MRLLGLIGAIGLMSILSGETTQAQVGRGDRLVGPSFVGRGVVMATEGAAATSQPLATQTAIEVLRQGGSAVDAAIAANAVLGVVEPTGAGMGGDLYAIVWDPKTKKLYGYNGSGRSAMGLDAATARKHVQANGYLPQVGAVSVSTPGAVDGWFALHDRFGRRTMAQNLQPAIGYARNGFVLTPVIGAYWNAFMRGILALDGKGMIEDLANARATYTTNGTPPPVGQVWRNPDLAASYEHLAKGGRDSFYKGDVARTIDAYMKRVGGYLRYEDLAAHHGQWVDPISTSYRGYEVWEIGGNTQGVAVLEALNIMETFDLQSLGAGSADALHVMIEAKKIAFADRARYLADPAFAPAPEAMLLSKDYARKRAAEIRMDKAASSVEAGTPPAHSDTVYLTVADKDGMMVSLIQSNFFLMGSGLVPDKLGFMLQNRGALFSFEPGHPNAYAPGKRPMQTIIPGFVTFKGAPFLAFGVMGGAMQPQGQVQVLANLIDFGMNVQEAGDAARWQHFGSGTADDPALPAGGEVTLESGIAAAAADDLRMRGHLIKPSRPLVGYGGYQAIRRDPVTGVYSAATELRFDGAAAGY
jgi:gamma-glutamyltranspeptidase/glutathione hydrolase